VLNSQGALSLKVGKLDDAEQQFARAAVIFKKAAGEKHAFYAHQLSNLGAVEIERMHYQRAEELLQSALDVLVPAVPDQRYTAIAHIRMAKALPGRSDTTKRNLTPSPAFARFRAWRWHRPWNCNRHARCWRALILRSTNRRRWHPIGPPWRDRFLAPQSLRPGPPKSVPLRGWQNLRNIFSGGEFEHGTLVIACPGAWA
jgi:tetratricopeptide (TPR) repeat protein